MSKNIFKFIFFIPIIFLLIFSIVVFVKADLTLENSNTIIQKTSSKIDETISFNQIASGYAKESIDEFYKGYLVSSKLYIPKINLETYVLENYSKEALLISVTKFYGGLPNEIGNYCIAGHNYGPSNMFQNLKDLNINDELYLTNKDGIKLKYVIYDIYKVLPNQTDCLSQNTNENIELTLITCTIDSEKRIIIKARTT